MHQNINEIKRRKLDNLPSLCVCLSKMIRNESGQLQKIREEKLFLS